MRADEIAVERQDLHVLYEAVGGDLPEGFRKMFRNAISKEQEVTAISVVAVRLLLDYADDTTRSGGVVEAEEKIRAALAQQTTPADMHKGDFRPVISAARAFRSAISRRTVHGTHPSYMAQQALFDALARYDGEPTRSEQRKLDDETIQASIEKATT